MDIVGRLRDGPRGRHDPEIHGIMLEAADEIERLTAPWRAVDSMDWEYLMGSLGHGGRDRFWKEVLTEMRRALAHS